MQLTTWFGLQCLLLAPRKENGNEPAGCFPKDIPPVPYSCPSTGKPRGTPDTLKEQPEIIQNSCTTISHFTRSECFKSRPIFLASFLDLRPPFLHTTITERLQNPCQMFHCLTFPTVARSVCGARREHIALRALETSPRSRQHSPSRVLR